MLRCVSGLIMLAVAGGVVLADAKADADLEKIQGAWDIKSLEVNGKKLPAPEEGGGAFVFSKGKKAVMKEKGQADRNGTFKIDSSKSPKELDLIGHLMGPKTDKDTEVIPCIYQLDGDTLRIAVMAEGPKAGRPSGFDSKKAAILTLTRQKK
jgi:uncharacterized protein (TIGR03067 family)